MNLNLTKDEYHETIMLYLIKLAQQNKALLKDKDNVVYTPEFDQFLHHIIKYPLGDLRTVYYREPAKTKLSFKRMYNSLELSEKDNVRIII